MGLNSPLLLGEGAFWDSAEARLVFVDIKGQQILCWTPGHDAISLAMAQDCGFAIPTTGGGYVAGMGRALRHVDASGSSCVLAEVEDAGSIRINDGTIAPDGTIWFGTMDDRERQPLGHVWSWRADRGLRRHEAGFVVVNGPAFTADGATCYITSSGDRTIFRARVHEDALSPLEPFIRFPEKWGYPDGMAADDEDHLWVAHWDGYRVTRFDPRGEAVATLHTPTARPTKPAFGGKDRQTLYITSASIGLDLTRDPLAGRVFEIRAPVSGPAMAVGAGTR